MPTNQLTLSKDQILAQQGMDKWFQDVRQTRNYTNMYALLGGAGTGKTTLVADWLKKNNIEPYQCFTISTSAIAAKNAQDKTGASTNYTVAQFIKVPQNQIIVHLPKTKSTLDQRIIIKSMDMLMLLAKSIVDDPYLWANDVQKKKDFLKYIIDFNKVQTQKAQKSANKKQLSTKKNQSTLNKTGFTDDVIINISGINVNELMQILPGISMSHHTAFLRNIENQGSNALNEKIVGFVDEIGMIPDEDMHEIERIAQMCNIALIGAGDIDQIEPVSGKMNRYMTMKPNDGYPYISRLTATHRQSTSSFLYRVIDLIRQGADIRTAYNTIYFDAKKQNVPISDVFVVNTNTLSKAGTLGKYLSQLDCIVTYTNKDVQKLTSEIRRYIYASEVQDTIDFDNTLMLGERIIVTSNEVLPDKNDITLFQRRLVNGMCGMITKIYTIDEIEISYKLHPRNMQWVNTKQMIKQTGLKLVDVKFDDIKDVQTIWVNTMYLSNPRVNSTLLKNNGASNSYRPMSKKQQRNTDDGTSCVNAYYGFHKNCIGNEIHPLYNEFHPNVVYITYGYVFTAHRAQGREWNHVGYYEDMHKNFTRTPQDVDRMRKIRYSGASRPRKTLHFLHNL